MSANVVTGREKVDLVIRFNGHDTNLEQVLLRAAKTKAHNMVRKYLMREFQKKEATAKIMLHGSCLSEIRGFRKCGRAAINIIHSESPDTSLYRYRRL